MNTEIPTSNEFDPLNPPSGTMADEGVEPGSAGDVTVDVILEVPVTL